MLAELQTIVGEGNMDQNPCRTNEISTRYKAVILKFDLIPN